MLILFSPQLSGVSKMSKLFEDKGDLAVINQVRKQAWEKEQNIVSFSIRILFSLLFKSKDDSIIQIQRWTVNTNYALIFIYFNLYFIWINLITKLIKFIYNLILLINLSLHCWDAKTVFELFS